MGLELHRAQLEPDPTSANLKGLLEITLIRPSPRVLEKKRFPPQENVILLSAGEPREQVTQQLSLFTPHPCVTAYLALKQGQGESWMLGPGPVRSESTDHVTEDACSLMNRHAHQRCGRTEPQHAALALLPAAIWHGRTPRLEASVSDTHAAFTGFLFPLLISHTTLCKMLTLWHD